MSTEGFTQLEKQVLTAIENVEARNAANAVDEFVPVSEVLRESDLNEPEIQPALESLAERRLVLLDGHAGVRSRVGHIIHCLRNSETLSRSLAPIRNVADVKYIRYTKQVPIFDVDLTSENAVDRLNQILEFEEIEKKSTPIVSTAIFALSSEFPSISQFQWKCTQRLLEILSHKATDEALVIVADTGVGKSLAYQIPLLLHILTKKLRAYLAGRNATNCSAILVFPRNVLARDQNQTLSELTKLMDTQFEKLKDRLNIPDDLKKFLRFKVRKDFGGQSREKIAETYGARGGLCDIIITNPETIKRRLLNPIAHNLYSKGVDLLLFDEVHLYGGLYGAYVAGLNARLKTILPNRPATVGMSATISQPEKHCQRLFCLDVAPTSISDRGDVLTNKTVEHHVIVKPRTGRPPLGVAIEAASCLIHNRRDGLANQRSLPPDERPKSISFSDSLDTTGRWNHDQNNLEYFEPRESLPILRDYYRGYPVFHEPAHESMGKACSDCHDGTDVIASFCDHYLRGGCWYFSRDSGDPNTWVRVQGPTNAFIPSDDMRSRRFTSQEVQEERDVDTNELFHHTLYVNGQPMAPVDVDNLIATSVLEVGVDFRNIHEIIMFGEIQSPATYKQKAGRGAREGNITDGLFVLTVAPLMPLASFYYRHFYRLVTPTLTPVPLEPSNPDSIRSHAFGSVLDFLAKKNLDIFNVIEIRNDESGVEAEFAKASNFLFESRVECEQHVRKFLGFLGIKNDRILNESLDASVNLLKQLGTPVQIEGRTKKFVNWIFTGSRDGHTLKSLEDQLRLRYDGAADIARSAEVYKKRSEELLSELKSLGGEYQKTAKELESMMGVPG